MLDDPDRRLREMVAGALETGPEGLATKDCELIAWALQYMDDIPPRVGEEGVVLVSPEATKTGRWLMAVVSRGAGRGEWAPSVSASPAVEWRREDTTRPRDDEIADFIRATEFGYNQLSIHGYTVLRVVLVRQSPVLLRTLEASISAEEKRRREIAIPY